MLTDDKALTNLSDAVRRVLNTHGHAFQYSVIRTIQDLYAKQKTRWEFESAEFPVTVRGKDTRIDLLFRKRDSRFHMIGECKRANPALSNWCFIRAPYTRRYYDTTKVLLQNILLYKGGIYPGISSSRSERIYHIGFELKSNLRGDATSDGRGSIEQASGQVLLGLNGMLEFFGEHQQFKDSDEKSKITFVPVIITTARILTSDVDLGSAEITNGLLAIDSVKVVEKSWIWLNYSQSSSLRHSQRTESGSLDLCEILESEFVRSIAIVSSAGIEEFFGINWEELID